MLRLHVAFALFGVFMLARHLPAAVRVLRGRPLGREARPALAGAAMPLVNVLLALVILAVAVKGLLGVLIWR
jgi:hypothetical protein